MGQTIAEKILSAHSKKEVKAGEIILAKVDFLMSQDGTTPLVIKSFNDLFSTISWTDTDRVHRLITQDIPTKVSADTAYQNAKQYSDKQNARIEHDKALARVMTAVLKDDTELFEVGWI